MKTIERVEGPLRSGAAFAEVVKSDDGRVEIIEYAADSSILKVTWGSIGGAVAEAQWEERLHPRGRSGQFIDKLPKELRSLAASALNYKSADEFRRAHTQSHLMDLSDPANHRWGRALTGYPDEPLTDVQEILDAGAEPGNYLDTLKYDNPEVYRAVTSRKPTITMYRAVPADAPDEIQVGDYVALRRGYAQMHLDSVIEGEQGVKGKIISKTVPKKDVVWGEADFEEWAYSPREIRDVAGSLPELYDAVQKAEHGDHA